MKKKLFICFFLSSFFVEAQTSVYHPFPDSNARWCGTVQWYDGTCDHTNNYSISIRGDTLINGNVYHLLEESAFTYSTQCPSSYSSGYYPMVGAIRQDTLQHKVFIYDSSINGDTIYYDFNLQVGDTLDSRKVIWGGCPGPCIITSIDSVLINGQYRNRYNFYNVATGGCADSSIIEGIGSISGLCSCPSSCFEYFASLTLFRQNGQILYSTYGDTSFGPPMYFMCPDYSPLQVEEINQQVFNINPNPATSELRIENLPANRNGSAQWQAGAGLKIKEIEIYSSLGEKVFEKHPTSDVHHLSISVANFPPGIYFITITDQAGNKVTKKVVKM